MAAHVFHDDLGCPEGTILYDGCDECEHRANLGMGGLVLLDQDRVEAIWRRMLVTEGRPADDLPEYPVQDGYLTRAEARAGKDLYYLAVLMERSGVSSFQQGLFYEEVMT